MSAAPSKAGVGGFCIMGESGCTFRRRGEPSTPTLRVFYMDINLSSPADMSDGTDPQPLDKHWRGPRVKKAQRRWVLYEAVESHCWNYKSSGEWRSECYIVVVDVRCGGKD